MGNRVSRGEPGKAFLSRFLAYGLTELCPFSEESCGHPTHGTGCCGKNSL